MTCKPFGNLKAYISICLTFWPKAFNSKGRTVTNTFPSSSTVSQPNSENHQRSHSASADFVFYDLHWSIHAPRTQQLARSFLTEAILTRLSVELTFLSGRLNRNSRSKRPGLLSAGSIESSLFVAPMTTISPRLSRPSIKASRVDTIELGRGKGGHNAKR